MAISPGACSSLITLTQVHDFFYLILIRFANTHLAFSPVTINAGLPDSNSVGAFYFNQTAGGSLWYNAAGNSTNPYYEVNLNEFGGWLICNWVHYDQPQLFWLNSYYSGQSPLPSNCVPALLVPEYI